MNEEGDAGCPRVSHAFSVFRRSNMDVEEIDRRRLAALIADAARVIVNDPLSVQTMSVYAKERRDGKTNETYDGWMERHIREIAVYNSRVRPCEPIDFPSAEGVVEAFRVIVRPPAELQRMVGNVPRTDKDRREVECDVRNGRILVTFRVRLVGYPSLAKVDAMEFIENEAERMGYEDVRCEEVSGFGIMTVTFSKPFVHVAR